MGLYLSLVKLNLGLVALGLHSLSVSLLTVGLYKKPYSETECNHNHEQRPYRLLVLLHMRKDTCDTEIMNARLRDI